MDNGPALGHPPLAMIGNSLRHYTIEEKLGHGGMGVVYRARDTRLGRSVAIKVLPPELVKDPERKSRFIREARAASAVTHPAIASVYGVEEEGDHTFIVMEHVDGSTLRQLVSRGELDISSAVEIGIQVAEALGRAHEAGIIHRDIKSDNIMVTRDGHPKILDFGLAKLLDPARGADGAEASQMETLARTQAGVILGTLAYMSPEQARGRSAGARSDIFSLGVVLYESATGRLPFTGASAVDTIHAIAYETPKPLSTVRADLPWSLQRVVDRCLRKEPGERYGTMDELAADLREVRKEIESGVSGSRPLLDRARWWLSEQISRGTFWWAGMGAAAGGLAVFLIMGGAMDSLWSLLVFALVAAAIYRWFRNRGQREVRRFVQKASRLGEVQLITFHRGQFTVAVEEPTARTYLKLNALLGAANEKLFHGEPLGMVVRDDMSDEELRRALSGVGVQFVRDGLRVRRSPAGAEGPGEPR